MGWLADFTALVLKRLVESFAKIIARDVKEIEIKQSSEEDEKKLEGAKTDEEVKAALKSIVDHISKS